MDSVIQNDSIPGYIQYIVCLMDSDSGFRALSEEKNNIFLQNKLFCHS